MLTEVNGNYNGEHIVTDEKITLHAGQRVIITILDYTTEQKKTVDLKKYMGRGEKLFQTDAGEYVKGLRDNDRV